MSQPTQQLPPWLQPSTVVVTDAAGVPIATNTEVVYVPPTYFGPSIPLGSLYIFGGSTEPPTIVFTPTTTAATPTATPTTTSPITTSATPTTTVPTTSTAITSPSLTTTTSPSATPSTTATNSASASSSLSSVSASSSISSVLSSIASSSAATSATSGSTSATVTSTNPSTTVSGAQPPTQTFTAPPTITATPARFGGLTKGQLVGVIVASILGLIFLFVLALFLCLWCKGRRNRRHRFQSLSPDADDYVFVPAGSRVPGEGSPRHSGEEADPFLQESSHHQSNWVSELGPAAGAVAAGTSTSRGSYRNSPLANVAAVADDSNGNGNGHERGMAQVAGAPVTRAPVSRVPPPTMGSNSSGTASTVSHASGFGVLLERPSISGVGYMPITHEHDAEGGRPLSQADLDRIDNGQVLPEEDVNEPNYPGAYAYSRYSEMPTAPPRLVIPAATPSPENLPFSISNPSSLQDLQEASVQTATRVKAQDLAPRSSPSETQTPASSARPRSGGFLGALGLGGIGALFKGHESSPRRSIVREQSSPLMEKDLEQGALFAPETRQVDSLGLRPAGTGLTAEGRRPVSNVSGRSAASGGTIFHDAHSSLPATPITPSLAPLPRAVTPAEPSPIMPAVSEHAWLASAQDAQAQRAPTPSRSRRTSYDMADADILDMPAPSALHHFSSGSSLKHAHARGASTDSGINVAPFPPPGLSTIRPVGWSNAPAQGQSSTPAAETQTGYPSPPVSLRGPSEFGAGMRGLDLGRGMTMDLDLDMDDMEDDLGLGHGISIDVLEEAPPGAEQGWRSISSAGTGLAYMDNGRRGTFGTLVQGPVYASEQGSLHSMRSHVTPGSVRSSGSAPASRHEMSISSASSGRPSLGSNSATSHNLARTGSLTSDNQRGRRPQAPGGLSTIVASPTKAHTPRTIASDTNTASSTVRPVRSLSPLGGPDFPLNAPWAAGLDNEWQASA